MTEDSVSRIVADHLGIAPEQARNTDDLWSSGLTSLAAVRILMDLEDEFGVTFAPELLTREAFGSVTRLIEVLEVTRSNPAAGLSG